MDRIQIDDASPTILSHRRPCVFRQKERRGKHEGDHEVPAFLRKILHRRDVLNSGDIDQNINSSVLLHRIIGQFPTTLSLAEVNRKRVCADFRGNSLELRFVDVRKHNARAFLSQHFRGCQTDAAGSPCYNRNFVF